MKTGAQIKVSYDDIGDVLYITLGKFARIENEEDEDGLYLRYDSDTHAPAGATVIDYKEYWTPKHRHLVRRLAKFFDLPIQQTEKAIQAAR